jgi:hypothetical protein
LPSFEDELIVVQVLRHFFIFENKKMGKFAVLAQSVIGGCRLWPKVLELKEPFHSFLLVVSKSVQHCRSSVLRAESCGFF